MERDGVDRWIFVRTKFISSTLLLCHFIHSIWCPCSIGVNKFAGVSFSRSILHESGPLPLSSTHFCSLHSSCGFEMCAWSLLWIPLYYFVRFPRVVRSVFAAFIFLLFDSMFLPFLMIMIMVIFMHRSIVKS